jgi:hypothetical protein
MDGTEKLPVTLNYDEKSSMGVFIPSKEFNDIENIEQYVIAPYLIYHDNTKSYEVVSYSFLHISQLQPCKDYLASLDRLRNTSTTEKGL